MEGWGELIRRGARVQAWAAEALPSPIAGQRVLVDEVRVAQRRETLVHVLASPPWSMKVGGPAPRTWAQRRARRVTAV